MFFQLLLSTLFWRQERKPGSQPAPYFRPQLEVLEDRTAPSNVQDLHAASGSGDGEHQRRGGGRN